VCVCVCWSVEYIENIALVRNLRTTAQSPKLFGLSCQALENDNCVLPEVTNKKLVAGITALADQLQNRLLDLACDRRDHQIITGLNQLQGASLKGDQLNVAEIMEIMRHFQSPLRHAKTPNNKQFDQATAVLQFGLCKTFAEKASKPVTLQDLVQAPQDYGIASDLHHIGIIVEIGMACFSGSCICESIGSVRSHIFTPPPQKPWRPHSTQPHPHQRKRP